MKQTMAIGLLLASSMADAAPDAFTATYAVSAKGLEVATLTATLSYQNGSYTYEKQTKANGLAALLSGDTLLERSQGTRTGGTLTPTSYLYQHKNRRKDKRDQFRFISPTKVDGQYNGQTYALDVPGGTLDMATLELHLMDALPQSKPLDYHVVAKGKARPYRLRQAGKETVTVPAGSYEAIRLEVVHDDKNYRTTLWLAPQLNYTLVQMRHSEDGETIESRLQTFASAQQGKQHGKE